jgi:hypothetical protein
MSDINSKDIAGYLGDNVEVWVFNPYHVDSTTPTAKLDKKSILRGATDFETTEEVSQESIKELGFSASKVLYGAAEYSASVTLTLRDLVNIARLGGISNLPTAEVYTYINVSDFKKVNIAVRYIDPNTGLVNFVKYVGGFKSASASTPNAVESTTEMSLDGGSDLIVSLDSDCDIVQHEGDGVTSSFSLPDNGPGGVALTADDILLVESPSGVISTQYTVTEAVDANTLDFDVGAEPASGSIVRIAVAGWRTTNVIK